MYYSSLLDLGHAIRDQKVSPCEVVEACLSRVDAIGSKLNAFITVLASEARDQANLAEADIKSGKWKGPLHGIPVAVKDFFDIKRVKTTAGFEQFRDRTANADAEVVKRLKQAGAIILGKTNMDSLGMATTGLTSCFGPVHNPWNDNYVSGGSSAGSAAAVAAGLCFATVDTDAVGSARLPAACCGVVGFKGSYDLISTNGILGGDPVDEFIRWMGHVAVTTRNAGDTAIMLHALASEVDRNFLAESENLSRKVRIGMGQNIRPAPVIRAAIDEAATVFQKLGYQLANATIPFGDTGQESIANIISDRKGIAQEAFSDIDVILLPTLCSTAPTVKEAASNPSQGVSAENTAFANYYGLPAISVPCGYDSNGMPIGLQIVGKPDDDKLVLEVAQRYNSATDFDARHPVA
jgi:aspartyl-tRNA(Asn)/glutamyl-tRNA(Gln) amidotransferase subunit A